MTPDGDDPILTADQNSCLTNALVLGALMQRRGLPWENIHDKLPEITWTLEKAWVKACHEVEFNGEPPPAHRPSSFTEFADEWLTVYLVTKRIES